MANRKQLGCNTPMLCGELVRTVVGEGFPYFKCHTDVYPEGVALWFLTLSTSASSPSYVQHPDADADTPTICIADSRRCTARRRRCRHAHQMRSMQTQMHSTQTQMQTHPPCAKHADADEDWPPTERPQCFQVLAACRAPAALLK